MLGGSTGSGAKAMDKTGQDNSGVIQRPRHGDFNSPVRRLRIAKGHNLMAVTGKIGRLRTGNPDRCRERRTCRNEFGPEQFNCRRQPLFSGLIHIVTPRSGENAHCNAREGMALVTLR
jgi:hypothetical protein